MTPLPDPPSRREEISTEGETVFTHDTRGWVEELQGACVLLAELPSRVAGLLEEHMREEQFAADDFLIRQGDLGDSLMVIRSGQVQIGAVDEHGHRHWIARCGRGQVLGEMALLTGEPRTADVIAVKPVRAMVLPAEEFHRLARRHPEISVVLTNIVARRLGASEHDVLAGKTLGGWLIHGRLGKGGMSVVYDAEDAGGRRAALKMMSHRLVYEEDACRQFQREAEIIQSFDHPHIVRMYDRFAAFHTYFLALEFCDGHPMDAQLKKTGPLPEEEVRKIVGQLAAGLGYAHRAGIIHRDIKPSNVMVGRDGVLKIMDFGLARPVDEVPSSLESAVVGTPAYMAPEQLLGERLTVAADLFALGAVIWELFTGKRLMGTFNFGQIVRMHAAWTPPAIRARLPRVSQELAAVIETCLALDPAERCVDLEKLASWAAPATRLVFD
jgi:CRP-like cAMP-binding protein